MPEEEDSIFATVIEVRKLDLSSSDNPVIGDHDAAHGSKEDTVSRENADICRRR